MSSIFDDNLYESMMIPQKDASLPQFLSAMDFKGPVHPITKRLFFDVAQATDGGKKSLTVSKNDTFWFLVDRFDQNKGKIAVNLLLTGAACAITLGGGPAIGLAGKVISWAAMQVFVALRVKYMRYKIDNWRKVDGNTSTKVIKLVDEAGNIKKDKNNKEIDVTVRNTSYDEILDRVRYVIENSDFTNAHDAFSAMFRDFEKVANKFFTLPRIDNSTIDANGQSQMNPKAMFKAGSIQNCHDAINLWELVCRFASRRAKIHAIMVLLSEFFEYVEMALSEYTWNSQEMAIKAWATFCNNGNKDPAQVITEMKLLSYNVKTGGWFRDLFSLGLNVKTFYGALPAHIKLIKSEDPKAPRPQLFQDPFYGEKVLLELLRREESSKFKKIAGELFDSAVKAKAAKPIGALPPDAVKRMMDGYNNLPKEKTRFLKIAAEQGLAIAFQALDGVVTSYSPVSLLGLAQGKKPSLDDVVGGALDVATGIGAGMVDVAIKGEKILSWDTFFGQFMSGTEFAAFGIDIVGNIVADIAFNWWDKRKLELNQQTAAKRLGTMKKFAKEEIGDYVDLIQSWGESYQKATGGGGLPAVVECFRHEAAMDSNMARNFMAELMIMTNKIEAVMQSVSTQAAVEINNYINSHASSSGNAVNGSFQRKLCQGHCYNSAQHAYKSVISAAAKKVREQVKAGEEQQKILASLGRCESDLMAKTNMAEEPCTPVTGPTTLFKEARQMVAALGIKL